MVGRSSARPSRAAIWSGRIARFTLAVLIVTVVAHRFDLISTQTGLALLGIGWGLAAFALISGIVGIRSIWAFGLEGVGAAFAGIVLAVLILAVPAYFAVLLQTSPPINDVTTDTADPPALAVAAQLRTPDMNPTAYPGAGAARIQEETYPDLQPLFVDTGPEDTHDAVVTVAQALGWEITDYKPPPDGNSPGSIEAVARTLLMGYRDDIAVRVTPAGDGSRVDIRSASRYGSRDFGENARRITAFLHALRETLAPTAGGER